MHPPELACAPVTENLTWQSAASACPTASGTRTPSAFPSAILIGTVVPAFHFEPGTGSKKPRIRYSTTYASSTLRVFPALSAALHVTVCTPGVLVSTGSQPELATPDPGVGSVACGEAVAPDWPTVTGVLLSVGARLGAVLSSLNDALTAGLSWFPLVSTLAA